MGDRRRAGQADRDADLAHARRIAAALDRVADVREDATLARGEAGGVGRAVGKLSHAGVVADMGHRHHLRSLSVAVGSPCLQRISAPERVT